MRQGSLKWFALVAAAVILTPAMLTAAPAGQAKKAQKAQKASKPQKKVPPFSFQTSVDKPGAIYKKGETITLSGQMLEQGKPVKGKFMRCDTFINGVRKGRKIVPSEETVVITGKLDEPGWFSMILTALDENKKPIKIPKDRWNRAYSGGIGAMVAPEEIKPSGTEPADFDAFWKAQRAELDKVPVKATRTEVSVPKQLQGKVVCYDVKVDCAGGMPVSGYLAMPAKAAPKSLPAIVSYHGAGVRSSYKPVWQGRNAIAFDVNAHGIDNGKDAKFYSDLAANELKNYSHRGKQNRDDFYFKGMYLRVMRALDYVKSLPEWDGKTLIVRGGSQGGGQSLAAAGLDPDVTLCVAGVPALGDHAGWMVGRQPGWPRLYTVKDGKPSDEKVRATVEYFDNNNFAKRIKCEIYLSTGFIDFTCAPTSVYTVYNSLPDGVKKHIDTTPDRGHDAPIPTGNKRVNNVITKK